MWLRTISKKQSLFSLCSIHVFSEGLQGLLGWGVGWRTGMNSYISIMDRGNEGMVMGGGSGWVRRWLLHSWLAFRGNSDVWKWWSPILEVLFTWNSLRIVSKKSSRNPEMKQAGGMFYGSFMGSVHEVSICSVSAENSEFHHTAAARKEICCPKY